ncbi:hypothetical protein MCEGE10_01629 [Flavobacteriaceae bacterium]
MKTIHKIEATDKLLQAQNTLIAEHSDVIIAF